jgi:uncharacterized protein
MNKIRLNSLNMTKYFLLSALFFYSTSFCVSQNIQRKGILGVSFYNNVPDSIVKKFNYKQGAVVISVVPNTTAAVIGIQPNDIILKIDEAAIVKPNEIFAAAKKLRAGNQASITVIRNGKELVLRGTTVERPKETSTTADVVYGEFAYKNGYVRTIYKTLKGQKPLGTIYFLQGLPCYSMDNFQQLDKTKQALDAMVERGFAVYRMEKADMGDNVNQSPCETMGFDEELAMYEAGYKHLLTLKEVDTSKIFLFGHSMGGITAPLLAQKFQPKGVAVYGTVFKPWMDYMLDAFLIQGQYQGYDLALLQDELQQYKPFVYDYFFGKQTAEEIAKTPAGLMALQNILDYKAETKLAASGRSPLVFKEINQHNMAKAWGNTKSYVLAVYGECDIAANNADDHKALINYVNKIHPGKGTFWQAPGTTHTFEEIGTMEEFLKWQKNMQAYLQYAATKFNPKVFDYVCNWMKEVAGKS